MFSDQLSHPNHWQELLTAVEQKPDIREFTTQSWKRCREAGLHSDHPHHVFLSEMELEQIKSKNQFMIDVAQPYMELVSFSMSEIPHLVSLVDADAWVIALCGTVDELGGRQAGFCEGISWSEKNMGTNGAGCAISTGQPVFIYGKEHYITCYNKISCYAAPIYLNKDLVGAFNISVPNRYAKPARMTLVATCAHTIETALSGHVSEEIDILQSEDRVIKIEELIAGVIHDIKNPLAVIRGMCQHAQLTVKDSEEYLQYYGKIIVLVDRLTQMVSDLLTNLKPEEPIISSPISVIQEVIDDAEILCRVRNIQLILDIERDAEMELRSNHFKRAIQNLIDNAIKELSDTGGAIKVRVDSTGDMLDIRISDTGSGIPVDIRDQLFKPFVFKRRGGSGMGMFIVHYIITVVHKGSISFQTQDNKGTTFILRLPVAK